MKQQELESLFGTFTYREDSVRKGAIILDDPHWEQNLVRVTLPIAHVRGAPTDGRVLFHKLVAGQLQGAWAEVVSTGLLGAVLTWDGTFCPRHMAWNPRRPLSVHSWAIAFDINAGLNGFGLKPATVGKPGSVHHLVPIFRRWGFDWGGEWKIPDGMHFEVSRLVVAPRTFLSPATVQAPKLPATNSTPEDWV